MMAISNPMAVGEVHGRLTCVGFSHHRRYRYSRFLCECGQEKVMLEWSVRAGKSKSCGCLQREQASTLCRSRATHGMTRTVEYRAYISAKARCGNKKRRDYSRYGGRGIKFLFQSFEEFYAELGPKPSPRYSVDRIDNDGHYGPGNVQWATRSEQSQNQSRWAKKPP